jgi:hypothetical protein
MTYKINDVVRFRKYNDTFLGNIIYISNLLGQTFMMVATEYRIYTIESANIIEKL